MSALAKIHIAKKELGLDEETYRAVLLRVTGKKSAADLNHGQTGLVIEEFKKLGWKPKIVSRNNSVKNNTKNAANSALAKKARAIWISLYQLGEIRNVSEEALEAFARRQLKCDAFKWANEQEVYKLIEALKAMAKRAGWPTHADQTIEEVKQNLIIAQCKKLNKTEPKGLLNMHPQQLTAIAYQLGKEIQGIK